MKSPTKTQSGKAATAGKLNDVKRGNDTGDLSERPKIVGSMALLS